jgi:outer membrane protein
MATERSKTLWALGATVVIVAGLAARPFDAPQAAAGAGLGWVNSEAILQALPEYAAAESTYQVDLAGYRAEIQRLGAQFDSARAAFDQQSIVLSPSAKQQKQDSLVAMQRRSDQRYQELQQRAQQRERELVAPVETRVKAVIEGIRAEKNLAFIFDVAAQGSPVVAADKTLDLTPIVVQRLRSTPPPQTPAKATGRGRGQGPR